MLALKKEVKMRMSLYEWESLKSEIKTLKAENIRLSHIVELMTKRVNRMDAQVNELWLSKTKTSTTQ